MQAAGNKGIDIRRRSKNLRSSDIYAYKSQN